METKKVILVVYGNANKVSPDLLVSLVGFHTSVLAEGFQLEVIHGRNTDIPSLFNQLFSILKRRTDYSHAVLLSSAALLPDNTVELLKTDRQVVCGMCSTIVTDEKSGQLTIQPLCYEKTLSEDTGKPCYIIKKLEVNKGQKDESKLLEVDACNLNLFSVTRDVIQKLPDNLFDPKVVQRTDISVCERLKEHTSIWINTNVCFKDRHELIF